MPGPLTDVLRVSGGMQSESRVFQNLVTGSGEQLMKQAGPKEKKCVHLSWGVTDVSLWHECKFCRLQAAEVSG